MNSRFLIGLDEKFVRSHQKVTPSEYRRYQRPEGGWSAIRSLALLVGLLGALDLSRRRRNLNEPVWRLSHRDRNINVAAYSSRLPAQSYRAQFVDASHSFDSYVLPVIPKWDVIQRDPTLMTLLCIGAVRTAQFLDLASLKM